MFSEDFLVRTLVCINIFAPHHLVTLTHALTKHKFGCGIFFGFFWEADRCEN